MMSVRRALRGLGLWVALLLLVLSMPGGALAQQFEVSASTFASGLMIVNLSSNARTGSERSICPPIRSSLVCPPASWARR